MPQRWLLVNAFAQVAVLLALGQAQPGVLLWSLLWTTVFGLLFWVPWVLQPLSRRPGLARAFWILWLIWLFVAALHKSYLGQYPDHGTLEFAASEPAYAWILVRDRCRWWMVPCLLLALPAGWGLAKGRAQEWPRPWRWLGLGVAIALLVFFDQRCFSAAAMGTDVTTLRLIAETRAKRMGTGRLRRAIGREVVPAGPRPAWNVLLLINESLNEEGLDPALMPGLGARMARKELVVFPRAYASGTMTDVQLPAIFSGLSPTEASEAFHRVPLVWHRARACGMATALLTVQRMNYYGFPDYLLADGLDAWSSADSLNLPLVNDAGADDGLLVERYRQWLRSSPGRPTFTVLHFNASHAPYLQKAGFTPCTEAEVARLRPSVLPSRRQALVRYWNSLRYLDAVQERVFALLAEQGLLDHTWIIATSDHGECFEGQGIGRSDDLRPETLHVPLWMRLPTGFPVAWTQALRANTSRLASNLDLAPTLAQALGSPIPPRDRSGYSLLEPLPPGRSIVADNGGEIHPRRPGVGAVLWEEGDALLEWNWHEVDGDALNRVVGTIGVPEPWTPARRAEVQLALAAHPVLQREGARIH